MFVTYFFGCYWLPVFLTWFEFDFVKLGPKEMTSTGKKVERCASPMSKMQESESSEIEETTEDFLNSVRGSDMEANVSSMAACIPSVPTGGSNNGALEFLPCYAMPNCGTAGGSFEETANAREASEASDSSEAAEARDTFEAVEPPQRTPLQTESVDHSSSADSADLASIVTAQRSVISVASSQITMPVNNTRTAKEQKLAGNGNRDSRVNAGSILVGSLSADSHGTYDLSATSTESSNVFDGVDTAPSRDVVGLSAGGTLNQGFPKSEPLEVFPEHSAPTDAISPKSTGSIAQSSVASSQFFNTGHPPPHQTLSSPRSAPFSISPIGGFKASNEDTVPATSTTMDTSRDSLLQNADFVGYHEGSYDFGDVSEASKAPHDEMITLESGEALSIPSADDSSANTRKM